MFIFISSCPYFFCYRVEIIYTYNSIVYLFYLILDYKHFCHIITIHKDHSNDCSVCISQHISSYSITTPFPQLEAKAEFNSLIIKYYCVWKIFVHIIHIHFRAFFVMISRTRVIQLKNITILNI